MTASEHEETMADYYRYYGVRPDEATADRSPTVWRTRDGREIPLKQMEERHLLNTLRAARGQSVKVRSAMRDALEDEVRRRGLTPLEDFECPEEAQATAAVSAMYTYWPRIPAHRRANVLSRIRLFLHDGQQPSETWVGPETPKPEKALYQALAAYGYFGGLISDAAKKRVADVFARWTTAMRIEEDL